jgi:hypothetical protein
MQSVLKCQFQQATNDADVRNTFAPSAIGEISELGHDELPLG